MPKSRTRSLSLALSRVTLALLLGYALPACSLDTDGIFSQTSNGTSGSGSGGEWGSGGQTPGQGGSGGQTTGQGGSGGQTTGQGGSGGSMAPEDCLDGVDNDGDGDADCADSDCTAGFSCEAAPPDGFQYAWTSQGTAPMPCADGSAPEQLFTNPAGPAECTACTCGNLAGAGCSPPQLSCFPGSTGCGGTAQDWSPVFANGACQKPTNLLGVNISLSCRSSGQAMVTSPGSCPASTSDFANKEPFQGTLDACPAKSSKGGCSAGTACVQKNPDPAQSLCIRADGDVACPAGFTKSTAYAGGNDTRACAACSCEPAPTCSGGTFTFFDNNQCQPPGAGNSPNIDVNDNTCRNVSNQLDLASWSVQANPPMPSGSCTPKGGEPMGEVSTQGAVTFCCK